MYHVASWHESQMGMTERKGTDRAQVLAWSGPHVVCWCYVSSKGKTGWKVHSTLIVGSPINTIDYVQGADMLPSIQCDLISGVLVLGTKAGIELWRTDPKAEVVVWDKLWDRLYSHAENILLAPSLSHLAWMTKVSEMLRVAYTMLISRARRRFLSSHWTGSSSRRGFHKRCGIPAKSPG